MCRTYAAGGEHISVAHAQLIHITDDVDLDVRNNTRFVQSDPNFAKFLADIGKVRVRRAAGKNLIADNKDGGGWYFSHACYSSIFLAFLHAWLRPYALVHWCVCIFLAL